MAEGNGANKSPKTPGYLQNTMSLIGMVIGGIALANIIFLTLMDSLGSHSSPYIGMMAYMVLPGFLVMGIALLIFGAVLERRRRHNAKPDEVPTFPRLDLNNPGHRARLAGIFAFVMIFTGMSALGSYRAYEFSETTQFCGQVCHEVMHPEYIAYSNSPHARVTCVQCHVGSGADWYVKSKLSGAYQIYAYARGIFPRPIPTPVANLRPAQDTCEQCHWPSKFHGSQFKTIQHYGNDEANTPFKVNLLMKTGGGDPDHGPTSGIHWHMNIGSEITYVSTDDKRQVIPWVQVRDKRTGKVTEYFAEGSNLTPEQLAQMPKRKMDCVDCHNRPSHIYVPPERSVENSMAAGKLDPKMPFLKTEALKALAADYKSTQEALDGIAKSLRDFYAQRNDVKKDDVEKAVTEVQRLFKATRFPEMKTDWRTHNDNIGHFYYNGCFRCHTDTHKTKDGGKAITKECTVCHLMLESDQYDADGHPAILKSVGFQHPMDMGDMRGTNCTDCHNGGPQ